MKNLILIRHGKKDGENIATAQLKELEENGIPWLNEIIKGEKVVIHLGSSLDRTAQTVKAFHRYASSKELYSFEGHISPGPRMGNDEMFTAFLRDSPAKREFNQSKNWFTAFEKHDPDFIKKIQNDMLNAVREYFENLRNGGTILMVGHTPLIEWLAFACDPNRRIDRNIQLKELTGFIFTEDNGQISVTGKIGF